MRKIFALILSLIVLMGCSNISYKTHQIKIGETSFDGETITFYHDQIMRNEVLTGSHFYYITESSKEKMDGILFSEDGSLRFLVDFEGNQEVLDSSGMIAEPSDSLSYQNSSINIYVLDANEVYDVRFKELDDYSVQLLSDNDSILTDINLDSLETQIEGWVKLEDCSEYVSPEDFDLFLQISKNRREVGELIRVWDFGKAELEDGKWIVFIREDEREYYLLEEKQVESLKELISK